MAILPADVEIAKSIVNACVEHGRQILASQTPLLEGKDYDFMPGFEEMTIHLYLAGVMWRFGEQFDLPTSAKDRGFISLLPVLSNSGMKVEAARRRIAELYEIAGGNSEKVHPVVFAGYNASEGDGSLARLFDHFRGDPKVSGAPFRLLDRAKPIAAILGLASFGISALIGLGWGVSIGIGLISAAAVMAVAAMIYHQMVGTWSARR